MAKITTGVSKNFNIPGIPWSVLGPQLTRACRTESQSYSKLANLTWAGSTTPMIRFETKNMNYAWAEAPITTWGRGAVRFTNYPPLVARMKLWSPDAWMGLWFHELGHIMDNTWNQDIGYPPKPWFVNRLAKHWGKPKVFLAGVDYAEKVAAIEAFELPAIVKPTLWDRFLGMIIKPVRLVEWNGERV